MTEDEIYRQSIQLLEKFVDAAKEMEACPIVFEIAICLLVKVQFDVSDNKDQFSNSVSSAIRDVTVH